MSHTILKTFLVLQVVWSIMKPTHLSPRFPCPHRPRVSDFFKPLSPRHRVLGGPNNWNPKQHPPWNYPGGVVPPQIVEGHYFFSTKWVGLDDGISTKWSAQRKQYKMTGHIHKQVILDEERNSMLYRSCSGGTCPCIKTKTHFVDMLRVTTNWVARFSVISKISGKGLYKMTPDFLT